MSAGHRNRLDVEAEIITISAHVDRLLDVDLKQLDRVHADRLAAIGNRLIEGARAVRMLRPRPQGSVGQAAEVLAKGTSATLSRGTGAMFGGRHR